MSELLVNTIKKADGTGSITVPADTGTVVTKDASNDVTLNNITAGGIYLGGTGSENYLDDYEEGTFTPTVSQGTVSAGNARYIKVGKLVTLWFSINQFSNRTSSDQITISGLPFTGAGGVAHGGVFGQYCDNDAQSIYMIGSGVSIRIVRNDSGAFHYVQYNDLNSTASSFYIGMTYDTP
jgi:hypothetical protein